jgi:hypothetical protein
MRTSIVVAGLLAASCGSAPPPAPRPAPGADEVPLLIAVPPEKPKPKPPEPEPPLPAARRMTVAWHTAKAGKSTLAGHAVAFRLDGSLAVIGQGEAERWTKKPTKKLAKLMPHFIGSLDAAGKPEWVRTIDVGNGWTKGVASGPDGSVLVTGAFEKTLKIEGKAVATSFGGLDIFVARFERDGRLGWVIRAGGAELDLANGISVAADGTSYVVGSISGVAKFGELQSTPMGDRDIFIAVFGPTGDPQWLATAGGKDSDEAFAVTLTPRTVCATGLFGGVAKFQGVTLTMPEPEPNKVANPSNAFVVCHSLSGDVLWAERIGTHTSFDRGWDIAALSDGSVAVTGDFSNRPFVARYSAGGKQLWFRHAIGDGTARGVVALPDDELLVATYFSGGELELPGRWRKLTVKARGADTLLAHYTASGEILATGQIAGAKPRSGVERDGDETEVARMAVSSAGRVAVTGRLWGEAVVEADTLLRPTADRITGLSGTDLVLVVLDPLAP